MQTLMAGPSRGFFLLSLLVLIRETDTLAIPKEANSLSSAAVERLVPETVSNLQENQKQIATKSTGHWITKFSDRLRNRREPYGTGKSFTEEANAFYNSVLFKEWMIFAVAWILLLRLSFFIESLELSTRFHHCLSFLLWAMAAAVFLCTIYLYFGQEAASFWLDGYVMELILSMENIFLYELILVSFKVPPQVARKALFVVCIFQMFFQMFLFMGIAGWIESLHFLPYVLGAWLIFLAFQTLKEDEHEGFDAASSHAYKFFSSTLGDRLLPGYKDRDFFFWDFRSGCHRITMLGPVCCCLLVVMLMMEVDVSLTKIEEIPNHFMAWTSSVLAAFALPELFEVVREMLRRFYLLKTGIGVLLLFFGFLLLAGPVVDISGTAQLVVMIAIVGLSCVLSVLFGLHPRDGVMYDSNDENHVDAVGTGAAGEALKMGKVLNSKM